MIVGVGIDILAVSKLEHLLGTQGKKFSGSVFTQKEIKYSQEHQGIHNLATAFTGKEAFIKAVGGIRYPDFGMKAIEILRMSSGQPYVELHGPLKEKYVGHNIFLSLSFTDNLASAVVVLEKL